MNVHESIDRAISRIEETRDVQVLLAVEYGSRAWGLDGPDSDHDIRFIYRETPQRAFSLFPDRDTIDSDFSILSSTGDTSHGPGTDVEMSGWSLAKALKLACASNPQIGEFLFSPVTYREDRVFISDLERISEAASRRVMANCYRGLAEKELKRRLERGTMSSVKSHLQILRGALTGLWIVQNEHRGGFPPIDFQELKASMDISSLDRSGHLSDRIDLLVDLKRSGKAAPEDVTFDIVQEFCLETCAFLKQAAARLPERFVDPEMAENAFRHQYPDTFGISLEEGPLPTF